jgi:pimeloyl-ACP methyl ester carboxylesterase
MEALRVILLPGLHGTERLFGPLLRFVPDSLHPTVITLPETGGQSYTELYEAIEPKIPRGESIVIVAESFSGPLAVRFAAANASLVRGLVLVGSFIAPPAPSWLRFLPLHAILSLPRPAFALKLALCGRDASSETISSSRRVARSVGARLLAARVRAALCEDCSQKLRGYSRPLLYLRGTRDRLVRRGSMEQIRRVRPDVEVHEIDAPHMILQTRPAEAWRAIEEFLKRLTPTSSNV